MSLCPFKYLVTECSTTSAPSANGRWKNGVMNVLSTTSLAPRARARRAIAAMSTSCIIGFVGVSTNTMRVLSSNARSTAASSCAATNVKSSPKRLRTRSNRRYVPPYRLFAATT